MAISWEKGASVTCHLSCEPALTTDLWIFWCYLTELEIGKVSSPPARA